MSTPEPKAYPALVGELLTNVAETLTQEEIAFYRASIPDNDARTEGAGVESAGVLDELIRLVHTALPHIMAKEVPGYGPLRLRYLLDSGHSLANHVATLDTAIVGAAGAGAAKTTSLRDTRTNRRLALRALKNLAGRREEQRARVRKVAKGTERPDERSRSLESIADELDAVLKIVPARVAADAGVTEELMKSLRTNATAVLSAREKAQGARGSIASLYDEMNVLDGRILHELRLLLGAFRDARVGNPSIPTLRSKLIQRSGKKKKDAKGEGAPANPAPGSGEAPK